MDNKQATILELRARKEIIKRLQYPLNQLKKAVEKEKNTRQQRASKLLAFETLEEAQEAYGYAEISYEEFYLVRKCFKNAETLVNGTLTATDIALGLLHDFIRRVESEKHDLEFELKSPEEKDRIRRERELLQEKIQQRKNCARR